MLLPLSRLSRTSPDCLQLVATVMDTEKGEDTLKVSKLDKIKPFFSLKKILGGIVVVVCLLAVMFGMGVLSALYAEKELHPHDGVTAAENVVHGDGHALVRREEDDGTSYPISTKTALSTIYGISRSPQVTTKVETVTGTTYVTVPADEVHISISVATVESSAEVCEVEVVTLTESYTITVIPTPAGDYLASSAALGDATVTGNPATVTEVQTELSGTGGLPDATVSGNPKTVTNVQTDYSGSSSLPDATVSGNPETVTDRRTDYSISSHLPDATVPGNPLTVTEVREDFSVTGTFYTVITVTDLHPSAKDMSTVTKLTTVQRTLTKQKSVVTITVTDLYQETAVTNVEDEAATVVPVSPTSTFTKIVFETTGSASTSTKTIQVPAPPYPTANNTIAAGPSGTVTVVPTPTTPIVISGATKKPEPRGWGGSNGTTNLGCAIMLIATLMFLL
ncbi:hypothetical protein ACJ41O_004248 [Fusarium nematophilum]